ncbi:MAG: EamA family transporter, partial [Nocardioides sp.]
AAVTLVNSGEDPDTLTTVADLDEFYAQFEFTGRRDGDESELDAVRRSRPCLRRLLTAERDDAVDMVNEMLREARALPQLTRHDQFDWHIHAVDPRAPLDARIVAVYGVVAVALPQFSYFSAVAHMPVAPALLIEFTAPAAVVVFLWLRHGERPGRVTVIGAVVAALGLLLVLDVLSGVGLSLVGVAWASLAMLGCATYFLMSGDDSNALPPIALAAGGMLVAALSLGLLGLLGLLDMHAETVDVELAGTAVAWWVPIVLLGVVTAAVSYVAGIAAIRRLGSRLASFVALLEVVSGVLWAWFLLDELPHAVQLLGGVLILAGVVAVKLGERTTARPGA